MKAEDFDMINKMYFDYYEECKKKKEMIDNKCFEYIKEIFKVLGFRKEEGSVNSIWGVWRRKNNGLMETVEIYRNYFGVFLRKVSNDVDSVMFSDLVDFLIDIVRGDGVTTISSYGVGAKTEELGDDCQLILSMIWDIYENDILDVLGGDDVGG